jgi:long-subunit fatty acid transport protein
MVAGPVRQTGLALGLSYSNYTSRDFTLQTSSTIDLRGVPVGITDSVISRGGLSDLRFAAGYRIGGRWSVGGGLHVITGSNRLESRRSFADSAYISSVQRAEISYAGLGVSAGVVRQFGTRFAVATMLRWDGQVKVDRDSARVATVDLPYTFGLGMRWQPAATLNLAGQAIYRTWSAANSDLLAQGGTGAENTLEVSAGGEYTPDAKRPTRWPLRFGGRYAQLPFPLVPGASVDEIGISAGTGMRFAQQRGGIDLSVEHVWRSEDVFSERGFIVWLGVSVRP